MLDHPTGLDKDGNNKPLPFPLFHSEILTQDWWSPEQDLGRIKVVISEGFARGIHDLPFERIKNVVVFSFQHAPQGKSIDPSFVCQLVLIESVGQTFWKALVLLGRIRRCGKPYICRITLQDPVRLSITRLMCVHRFI